MRDSIWMPGAACSIARSRIIRAERWEVSQVEHRRPTQGGGNRSGWPERPGSNHCGSSWPVARWTGMGREGNSRSRTCNRASWTKTPGVGCVSHRGALTEGTGGRKADAARALGRHRLTPRILRMQRRAPVITSTVRDQTRLARAEFDRLVRVVGPRAAAQQVRPRP
jgi:hypothetical protein